MPLSIENIQPVLPTSEQDSKIIEYFEKRAYGFVYTPEGNALRVVGSNPLQDEYIVQAFNDAEHQYIPKSSVSVVPNDKEFEDFKKNLDIFEAYDSNGVFNMDSKFHAMFAETTVVESAEDVKDCFMEGDVFITNDTSMHIVYNTNRKDFFVVSLQRTHTTNSLDLALKDNYEFNKSLLDDPDEE